MGDLETPTMSDCGHCSREKAVVVVATAEDKDGKVVAREERHICGDCAVGLLDGVIGALGEDDGT